MAYKGTTIGLTQRQLEVVALISYGYSQCETARRMGLKRSTVIYHFKNIYRKYGFRNLAQFTRWAVIHGLDDPDIVPSPKPRVNPKMRGFFGIRSTRKGVPVADTWYKANGDSV
jgi:DNA-binding CsgD family transcriptional regulator